MTRREAIRLSMGGLSAALSARVANVDAVLAAQTTLTPSALGNGAAPCSPPPAAAVRALATRVAGDVVSPGDSQYDLARRVWNGAVNRAPALIVRASGPADVAEAIAFAREYDLPLAVRSGGHGLTGRGTIDCGLIVDLSAMKQLTIDPVRRIARADPGLTWGEYAEQAQAHGLATTSGDVASVGLGGLTLGGGIGWFVRKQGLTIDNLLGVEMVTADRRLIAANHDEHPDLFWALRGGGGNFGVATALTFRLHPVGTVLAGAVFYDAAEAAPVIRAAADYAAHAPDGLTIQIVLMSAPPAPFIPADRQGALAVAILVCWSGDLPKGEHVIAPLRSLGTPIADIIAPMPYPGIFALTEPATVKGEFHDVRSMFVRALDDAAIETIVEHTSRTTQAYPRVQIRVVGGAMARVPADDTAFSHRDKPFMVSIFNSSPDSAEWERNQIWLKRFWRAMRPWADGVYVNFLGFGDEREGRLREAYSATTLARLKEVKDRYDPEGIFSATPLPPGSKLGA